MVSLHVSLHVSIPGRAIDQQTPSRRSNEKAMDDRPDTDRWTGTVLDLCTSVEHSPVKSMQRDGRQAQFSDENPTC